MNFRGPIKNGFFWKCSLFAHSTQHVLFLAMVASARKDLFKEAAIVLEQDAWTPANFGSQRLWPKQTLPRPKQTRSAAPAGGFFLLPVTVPKSKFSLLGSFLF